MAVLKSKNATGRLSITKSASALHRNFERNKRQFSLNIVTPCRQSTKSFALGERFGIAVALPLYESSESPGLSSLSIPARSILGCGFALNFPFLRSRSCFVCQAVGDSRRLGWPACWFGCPCRLRRRALARPVDHPQATRLRLLGPPASRRAPVHPPSPSSGLLRYQLKSRSCK